MKMVCLNGSPRLNGNTNVALKTLEELVKAKDASIEVAHVDLSTLALRPFTEEGGAIKDDDTAKLLKLVAEADVLVMGTPVYWWGMSAQLKMLIDNFECCVKDMKAISKKLLVVSVGASPVSNVQYELIERQCQCIAEFLKWQFVGALPFSAFGAGDVAKQADFKEILAGAAQKLI